MVLCVVTEVVAASNCCDDTYCYFVRDGAYSWRANTSEMIEQNEFHSIFEQVDPVSQQLYSKTYSQRNGTDSTEERYLFHKADGWYEAIVNDRVACRVHYYQQSTPPEFRGWASETAHPQSTQRIVIGGKYEVSQWEFISFKHNFTWVWDELTCVPISFTVRQPTIPIQLTTYYDFKHSIVDRALFTLPTICHQAHIVGIGMSTPSPSLSSPSSQSSLSLRPSFTPSSARSHRFS